MCVAEAPYVLVAPGYLAGSGQWDQLTELLLHGHRWHDVSTVDEHTALASPEGRLRVTLSRRAEWTWALHAATPGGQDWTALIGAQLPVEYITAMVDALLRPPSDDHQSVLGPLRAAGWAERPTGPAASAVSPDGLVQFAEESVHFGAPSTWRATCAVNGFRWWTADFSAHTPPSVVNAFARSLASDDPLPRMAIGTPLYGCESHTRLTPTSHTYEGHQALLRAWIAEARSNLVARSGPVSLPPHAVGHTSAARTR